MIANEVLKKLKEGNQRFADNELAEIAVDPQAKADLVKGQSPYAIVLSCADSRVVPELIFNTGMGELFVVRVAGNVANTSSLASMEYAVAHLNTSVIIVLGHQNCGAVTAAVKGGDNGSNINHLLGHIKPAIMKSNDPNSVEAVTRSNAELTARTIIDNSEIISDAIEDGKLMVVPAYYHLDSGIVEFI